MQKFSEGDSLVTTENSSVNTGNEIGLDSNPKLISRASLTLQAIPEGSVYINGEIRFANAARRNRLELDAGDYNIDFRHPQYGSKQFSVQLKAGQKKQLRCYFERYINIQSLDESGEYLWSTVIINGKDIGEETPVSKYPLSVGSHKITVRRSGYETVEGVQTIEIKTHF